jgi:hypothetical protein
VISTNPDLTLASTNIADMATRNILDGPGCGHRMITLNFRTKPSIPNNKPQHTWNFKMAKWHKYMEELDLKISDPQFNFQNKAPDKNCEKFCRIILHTAKQHKP